MMCRWAWLFVGTVIQSPGLSCVDGFVWSAGAHGGRGWHMDNSGDWVWEPGGSKMGGSVLSSETPQSPS